MFKKIVSNLPFSPALVGQLGFYTKRLRKEEATRQLGLIFVVLTLIIQLLVIFQPPESANSSSPNDTFSGSIAKLDTDSCANNTDCIANVPNILKTKTATNASQGFVNASSVIAHASDQISYTIFAKNISTTSITTKLEDNIADILEYSSLVDSGGGVLNKTTGTLSWSNVTLKPSSQQSRTFVIRLPKTIPATAQGKYNLESYDCIMKNQFGNSIINIKVDCPTQKIVESIALELPRIGPTENIIFAIIILLLASFLYTRARLFRKEIYIIRKNTNAGII